MESKKTQLKITIIFLLFIAFVVHLIAFCLYHDLPPGKGEKIFKTIQKGMTLSEIESILGEGVEIPPERLPMHPEKEILKPVIKGDIFYLWDKGEYRIIIGFVEGKVFEKYLWEPSF